MEDFVPYETVLKLEKKGYKGKTIRYHGHIYDVLKWLREKKKLHISIEYGYEEIPVWDFEIRLIGNYGRWWTDETYSSYELAVLAGIEYVIDNLI